MSWHFQEWISNCASKKSLCLTLTELKVSGNQSQRRWQSFWLRQIAQWEVISVCAGLICPSLPPPLPHRFSFPLYLLIPSLIKFTCMMNSLRRGIPLSESSIYSGSFSFLACWIWASLLIGFMPCPYSGPVWERNWERKRKWEWGWETQIKQQRDRWTAG